MKTKDVALANPKRLPVVVSKGRSRPTTGDWTVRLGSITRELRSLENGIEQAGARLTHAGTLRRVDGARFRSEEAGRVLSALGLFLSFAAGWWVGFVRGKNSQGKEVWQLWGISRMQATGAGHSWHHHWKLQGMLARLFPGFVRHLGRIAISAPDLCVGTLGQDC